MKYNKLYLALALATLLFASCKRDHYDTGNVHGVNAEGEVLLPVGLASLTVMNMMQQFKIDTLITCSEDGNLSYNFHYEDYGVVSGENLLQFKDLEYSDHFSFENPFPFVLPQVFDTVFCYDQTLVFESDNIHVMEAEMKTGHFDINVNSNLGLVQRIVLRSSDIKDAEGQDLVLDFDFNSSDIQFDLDGLHYITDTANTLDLKYEVYVRLQSITDPELFFDVEVLGNNLAIKEMIGYVDTYDIRNYIDTSFVLFPSNVSGALEVYVRQMDVTEKEGKLINGKGIGLCHLVGV